MTTPTQATCRAIMRSLQLFNPVSLLEDPFPYFHGDETEPQLVAIRAMLRMNIEGQMIVDGINPVYWYNSSINNGDGTGN